MNLNENEKTAINELGKRMKDVGDELDAHYLPNALCLYKFLKARQFDVGQAEEMLRKHLKWRKDNNVTRIHSKVIPAEVEEEFSFRLGGKTREGLPVVYFNPGRWDPRGALKKGWKSDLLTFMVQIFERCPEICKSVSTKDKRISEIFVIVDLDGFEFQRFASTDALALGKEVSETLQNNYPASLRAIRAINTPKIFQLFWMIIKPFINDFTLSRIQIMGTNKDEWRKELLEHVDPESIPSNCGGAITSCFNYKMSDQLNKVFPQYETLPEAEMVTTFVQAGTRYQKDFDMKVGGRLSWNFKTEGCDIGFQLDYEDFDEVIPYCRVDSHVYVQKGMITCDRAGKYSLIFDNSYSSFTGKTLKLVAKPYAK